MAYHVVIQWGLCYGLCDNPQVGQSLVYGAADADLHLG